MSERHQAVSYVPPQASASITASTQSMEARPTFRGQVDGARLVVFAVVAIVPAVLLYVFGAAPVWLCAAVWLALFVGFYVADLLTVTGYFHKRLEQGTERLRIEAALAQNQTGDAAQQAQIDLLLGAVGDLQDRVDALERTFVVRDNTGSRTVTATDETDTAIRRWLRETVFGGGATPVGVHRKTGQLASAMPFKDGSDGFRRLQAAGLCARDGNGNYLYVGPANVLDALEKLSKQAI